MENMAVHKLLFVHQRENNTHAAGTKS